MELFLCKSSHSGKYLPLAASPSFLSEAWISTGKKTVELAKSPSSLNKTASAEQKRELLKIVLSNLTVSGKKVEIMLTIIRFGL